MRQVADAAVERDRLTQLVEELRESAHRHEFVLRQIGERTSELHGRDAGARVSCRGLKTRQRSGARAATAARRAGRAPDLA